MEKRCIGLGVSAGLFAGLVCFGYTRARISPLIDTAVDYEEGRAHSHSHEVFSRSLQENIGAGVGVLAFGVVMGALFAVGLIVILKALQRRSFHPDARWVSLALAAAAFIAVAVVPALVYPPNPPGVGYADTIGERTTAHLVLTVTSVALAWIAAFSALRTTRRLGAWRSSLVHIGGYVVAMIVVSVVLPSFHEVPGPVTDASGAVLYPGFPAEVLSDFRTDSLINQAVLWAVIGTGVAALIPRITIRVTSMTGALHGNR